MTVPCLEPVEVRGVEYPCARDVGHDGPHSPGRCNAPVHYAGREYACSLAKGHAGGHDTWIREADADREYDRPEDPDRGGDDYSVRRW